MRDQRDTGLTGWMHKPLVPLQGFGAKQLHAVNATISLIYEVSVTVSWREAITVRMAVTFSAMTLFEVRVAAFRMTHVN